ncbi:MAG TPA: hypothetical protein VMW75_22835 [Thermoanaerobaculia bacterium]|nr:hypothetical protein [Thermoanaerobaculia bacterium]
MPLDIEKLIEPTFKELFEKTGQLHFAVMAIGATPDKPPTWAIEACALYYFQQTVSVEAPAAGRPPSYSFEDGVLLDEVADLIVEGGLSVTAAVKQVTKEESDGTNFRRLMRIWKRHLRPELLAPAGSKRGKTNKWLDRAHARKHERFMTEVWNEAKAEIESGNLSVEVDPEEEQRRLEKAQWFNFPPDLNPGQDAQFKIAPLSRRLFVIEVKRLLLHKREEAGDKTP